MKDFVALIECMCQCNIKLEVFEISNFVFCSVRSHEAIQCAAPHLRDNVTRFDSPTCISEQLVSFLPILNFQIRLMGFHPQQ